MRRVTEADDGTGSSTVSLSGKHKTKTVFYEKLPVTFLKEKAWKGKNATEAAMRMDSLKTVSHGGI